MTLANWLELVGVVATVLPGLVPTRAHALPYLGRVLYWLARGSVLTPPDAKGTLKLPGGKITLHWESAPRPTPSADIRGFWPVIMVLALAGCIGTQTPDTANATRTRILKAAGACIKAAVESVTSGSAAR